MTYLRLTRHASLRLTALSLLASLSACSSDKTPAPPTQVGTLVGTFGAEFMVTPPAFTKFEGKVFDAAQPDTSGLKFDSEQNGCQLLVAFAPFCSPTCDTSAEVCAAGNVCMPYPTPQNVGTVHLTGLGPTEVVIQPADRTFGYTAVPTLPYPSCSEGDAITVQADAFKIEGKCIAPLTLLGADPIPVKSGKGVPLTWTPPAQSSPTRIQVKLEVAHHGGKKGEIHCEVPDTGSFEIPEPLVTKLVSLGLAGFPTVVVTRISSASAPTESEVKLTVASSIERAVDTGVISCASDDTQCPTGQTCQPDLSCK